VEGHPLKCRKRILWIFSYSLIIILSISPLSSLSAQSKSMEEIISRAPNLKSFLKNSQLKEEYFKASAEYFGAERFPRVAFDAIWKLTDEMIEKVPELEERVWKPRSVSDPYTIEVEIKSYGRKIEPATWSKRLSSIKSELSETARAISNLSDSERSNLIETILLKTKSQLSELTENLEKLKGGEKKEARARGFSEIYANPQLKAIGAWMLLQHLESRDVSEAMKSNDADLVLEICSDIHQNPRQLTSYLPANLQEAGKEILSQSAKEFPSLDKFLADETIFPKLLGRTRDGKEVEVGQTRKTSLEVKEVSRPFHALFRGPPHQECVGGGCAIDGQGLESLTPEKIFSVALSNSSASFVEKNERYSGYIEMTGIEFGGRSFQGAQFSVPIFTQKTSILDSKSGQKVSAPVFELWVKKAAEQPSGKFDGVVYSESFSFNNAGVTPTIFRSPSYILGKSLGDSMEAKITDPLAAKIVENSHRQGNAQTYGGRMIVPAMVPDAGTLTVLDFSKGAAALNNETAVREVLEKGPAKKLILAFYLTDSWSQFDLTKLQTPEIANRLLAHTSDSHWAVHLPHDVSEFTNRRENILYDNHLHYVRAAYVALTKIFQHARNLPQDFLNDLETSTQNKGNRPDFTMNIGSTPHEAFVAVASAQPDYPKYLWDHLYSNALRSAKLPYRDALIKFMRAHPDNPYTQQYRRELIERGKVFTALPLKEQLGNDQRRGAVEYIYNLSHPERMKYQKNFTYRQNYDALLILLESGFLEPEAVAFGKQVASGNMGNAFHNYLGMDQAGQIRTARVLFENGLLTDADLTPLKFVIQSLIRFPDRDLRSSYARDVLQNLFAFIRETGTTNTNLAKMISMSIAQWPDTDELKADAEKTITQIYAHAKVTRPKTLGEICEKVLFQFGSVAGKIARAFKN
jgi:hypothetical protein